MSVTVRASVAAAGTVGGRAASAGGPDGMRLMQPAARAAASACHLTTCL